MTIHLVRHAPTEANLRGIILGSGDSPLAEGAEELLRLLARSLAGRGTGQIYSSPLGRALSSARFLSHALDVPMVVLPGLAELSAGSLEGRRRREVLPPEGLLRSGRHDRPGGGESYADATPRVREALRAVLPQSSGGSALVVAHSVVNRLLLSLFANRPLEEFLSFTQPHGVILRLGSDGAVFRRDARPPFFTGEVMGPA